MRVFTTNIVVALILLSGCSTTRVIVIDRQSDWVKLGPDVRGHVYFWDHAAKAWSLTTTETKLPEGWVAGPGAKDK